MRRSTYQRLQDLWQQLEWTHPDSDHATFLKDEIRRLPGFPAHTDETREMIHFEVID
jgi:hypothetical protein